MRGCKEITKSRERVEMAASKIDSCSQQDKFLVARMENGKNFAAQLLNIVGKNGI